MADPSRGRRIGNLTRILAVSFVLICPLGRLPAAHATGCGQVAPRTSAEFGAAGPYAVGVRTATYVDSSRPTPPNGAFAGAPDRTLVTEIWYPALSAGRDMPVDASGGPYPVIVHSHGFRDNRLGESYVTEHLASRGFIVASASYPLSRAGAPGGATV